MAIQFDINADISETNLQMAVDPVALEAWEPVAKTFTPAIAAHMRSEYTGGRELRKDATYTTVYAAADRRAQAENRLPEAERELAQLERKLEFMGLFNDMSTEYRYDTWYPVLRERTALENEVRKLKDTISNISFTLEDVNSSFTWQLAESCILKERSMR